MGVSGQHHAPAALYHWGKDPQYPLYRRLGGPQSHPRYRGQKKNPRKNWFKYLLISATNSWITSIKKRIKMIIGEESFSHRLPLVLTKFYLDFHSHNCYDLLLQCLHQAHIHCQMRFFISQSPKLAPVQFLLYSSKFPSVWQEENYTYFVERSTIFNWFPLV
jgi:hypothetical protein